MTSQEYIFTSESVSEGHPDKICDQISDAVVDFYMANCEVPEKARVACETMVTTNKVIIAGEVRGDGKLANVDSKKIESITREVIRSIGYEQETFHWNKLDVSVNLHAQSQDIGRGVDGIEKNQEGAGDQGIMFGYATNETEVYMPYPLKLSHELLKKLKNKRIKGEISKLGPDAKSQFSIKYENGKPVGMHSVVLSVQHEDGFTSDKIKDLVLPIIEEIKPSEWSLPVDNIFINPTGNFVIGGPHGDAGLTGRKIVVDTYGGVCPHGGGAFSGKDPSKVDRSGAYVARYIAKNLVAAGIAEKCTIQLAYIIGVAEPISIFIDTHGTGKIESNKLISNIREIFDLTPSGIRNMLNLAKPIYQKTASFGHFGRKPSENGFFTWENLDKVAQLKALL
jgi:S-adenosylmethionine synthetase